MFFLLGDGRSSGMGSLGNSDGVSVALTAATTAVASRFPLLAGGLSQHPGVRPCERLNRACVEPPTPSTERLVDVGPLWHCSLRRHHWLGAGSTVTRALLADAETSPWLISARAARLAAGTSSAAVWLAPSEDSPGGGLHLAAFDGKAPDEAVNATMADQALFDRMWSQVDHLPQLVPVSGSPQVEFVLAVPMLAADKMLGVLTLPTDERDSPRCPAEQLMIATFCAQTALACQLAQAQRDQSQMALYADRDRIARDLHDQIIQQLFGAGLALQSIEQTISGGPAGRVHDVVVRLDRTIVDIRRSIFSLHQAEDKRDGLHQAVVGLASEAALSLGFSPRVHLVGPLNQAVPVDAVDDILAVVMEGLSNVARHARASSASVNLTVDEATITVEIVDNGLGIGLHDSRRSGLVNLSDRAVHRGGRCDIGPSATGTGTTIKWQIPLASGH